MASHWGAKLLQFYLDFKEYVDSYNFHFHNPQKVYPSLSDDVEITGGINAWELSSNFTEIVPASSITSKFDIHYINVGDVSDVDVYEIVLYSGTLGNEVEIARCKVYRLTNPSTVHPVPIQTPILDANTRISAKIASSTGGNDIVAFSIFYHLHA